MLTRYAKAGIAVLIGFMSLLSPLIGFSAVASPLLQATPTAVTRTPNVQNTQVAKPTLDALPPSGGMSVMTDRYYEVKAGDTLWSIAANMYGNGSLYILIQQANRLPEKVVLRVGSKLLIPSIDAATPTLAPNSQATEYIKPTAAPSPQNTVTNTSAPTPSSSESLPDDSETKALGTTNKSNGQQTSFLIRYIQLSAYLLSIVCFVGSLYCAYLSFEVYQRNRLYIRRRYIGDRVRAGL